MDCMHNRVVFVGEKPYCLDCDQLFTRNELALIYRKRENACKHPNPDRGYASNPPKAWCPDCQNYIRDTK